jgi:hypothetical protein
MDFEFQSKEKHRVGNLTINNEQDLGNRER